LLSFSNLQNLKLLWAFHSHFFFLLFFLQLFESSRSQDSCRRHINKKYKLSELFEMTVSFIARCATQILCSRTLSSHHWMHFAFNISWVLTCHRLIFKTLNEDALELIKKMTSFHEFSNFFCQIKRTEYFSQILNSSFFSYYFQANTLID